MEYSLKEMDRKEEEVVNGLLEIKEEVKEWEIVGVE